MTIRRPISQVSCLSVFDQNEIYSEEYLDISEEKETDRLVFEKTIGRREHLLRPWDLGEWEIIAEGKLDILANIPYDSIIDTIFGTALIRVLLSCLNVIGYVGSTYGFIHLIWVHCQKQNAEEEEEEERPESETE